MGIMEKEKETTTVYDGYMGIMGKKIETTPSQARVSWGWQPAGAT